MNIAIYKSYINALNLNINSEESQNIFKALTTNYNAVCLDIDGTLVEVEKDNTNLLKKVISIMNKGIPVCFITGRGETGIKDFKNELLKVDDSVRFDKTICVINDGAFACKMDNLDNFISLVNSEDLLKLSLVYDKLEEKYGKRYDIIKSISSSNGSISNIRIVCEEDIFENLYNDIKSYSTLNITRGNYNSKQVYQIGVTNKEKSLHQVENFFGIPKNSMLRVGDSGDINGNDYSILNCTQGFSVGTSSNIPGKCNPVIDENGNILFGIEATSYLLDMININQAITLERITDEDKNVYKNNFVEYEIGSIQKTKQIISKYDKIISNIYGLGYTINDIYDENCGAILLKEDDQITNSKFKNFLLDDRYSMKTSEGIILRGGNTYYSIMIMRKNKIVSSELVDEWKKNYISYINEAISCLDEFHISNTTDRKLLLGYLDNLRNILILFVNRDSINLADGNGVISYDKLDIDSNELQNMNSLLLVNKMMEVLTFKNEVDDQMFSDIKSEIFRISNYIKNGISNIEYDRNSNEVFRVFREIDNFSENYIAVREGIENGINSKNVCGLAYGAIELPFIAKVIDSNIVPNIMVLDKKKTSYIQKHSIDATEFQIQDFSKKYYNGLEGVCVADDNLLTGKTMQISINALLRHFIDCSDILVVRRPGSNRVNHMFLENHGAINIELCQTSVKGMCFPSPYADMDGNSYTNKQGVFNLNRQYIVETILMNGYEHGKLKSSSKR